MGCAVSRRMLATALRVGILVAMQVKNDEPSGRHRSGEDARRVVLPVLRHPHGIRVEGPQSIPHSFHRGLGVGHARRHATLMKGVDGIEVRGTDIAEKPTEGRIIVGSELLQAVGVVDERRTREGAPLAAVNDIGRLPTCHFLWCSLRKEVLGNHAYIARDDGLHTVLTHATEDALGQCLLLLIPMLGLRTAPGRKIVHEKPSVVSATADESIYFVERIAVRAHQHLLPYALHSRNGQRHVHAVQRHPIQLALPTVPVPEGHGITIGAEVEVVAEGYAGGVCLLWTWRQWVRQLG